MGGLSPTVWQENLMKTIQIVLCAVLFAAASTLSLPANGGNITIGGSGGESCESWAEHRPHGAYTQWVLGFISGAAWRASSSETFDPLDGTNARGVWAWIDNYCAANPLEKIADAAVAFMKVHPRAAK
jgi:hypothetical protein